MAPICAPGDQLSNPKASSKSGQWRPDRWRKYVLKKSQEPPIVGARRGRGPGRHGGTADPSLTLRCSWKSRQSLGPAKPRRGKNTKAWVVVAGHLLYKACDVVDPRQPSLTMMRTTPALTPTHTEVWEGFQAKCGLARSYMNFRITLNCAGGQEKYVLGESKPRAEMTNTEPRMGSPRAVTFCVTSKTSNAPLRIPHINH